MNNVFFLINCKNAKQKKWYIPNNEWTNKPTGKLCSASGKNWLCITNCRIINSVWNPFYITPFTFILTTLTIIIHYAFVLLLFLEGEWELSRLLSKFMGRTWPAGKGEVRESSLLWKALSTILLIDRSLQFSSGRMCLLQAGQKRSKH